MIGQTVLLINELSRIIIVGKGDCMQMFHQDKKGEFCLIEKTTVAMPLADEACALRWFNGKNAEIFNLNVRNA